MKTSGLKDSESFQKQAKNQQELEERFARILNQYGYGEITDWVIRTRPYWERMIWTVWLLEADTGKVYRHSEIVKDFGEVGATTLRTSAVRLKKGIIKKFPVE